MNSSKSKWWQDYREMDLHCWRGCKLKSHSVKTIWPFLNKQQQQKSLQHCLSNGPAIVIPTICSREMKTPDNRSLYIVLRTVLFVIEVIKVSSDR